MVQHLARGLRVARSRSSRAPALRWRAATNSAAARATLLARCRTAIDSTAIARWREAPLAGRAVLPLEGQIEVFLGRQKKLFAHLLAKSLRHPAFVWVLPTRRPRAQSEHRRPARRAKCSSGVSKPVASACS